MGDWNAKIGDKAVEGISGTHGLGDRNEADERMIEFCEANQLIVIPIHGINSQDVDYTHGHHLMDCIKIKSTIS